MTTDEMLARATRRPWFYAGDIETVERTVATDPYRDGPFATNETWEADAALIVTAVNNYERLRDAASKAIDLIEDGPAHESLTSAQLVLGDALRESEPA